MGKKRDKKPNPVTVTASHTTTYVDAPKSGWDLRWEPGTPMRELSAELTYLMNRAQRATTRAEKNATQSALQAQQLKEELDQAKVELTRKTEYVAGLEQMESQARERAAKHDAQERQERWLRQAHRQPNGLCHSGLFIGRLCFRNPLKGCIYCQTHGGVGHLNGGEKHDWRSFLDE